MTAARRGALWFVGPLLLVAAAALGGCRERTPSREKPTLLLLTSLPLVFGEDFSVRESGSPALRALETRYRVVPISTTSAVELKKGRLLLMAQPLGQAPQDLVALDSWVRDGGRLVLLADPMLEWPSRRPLGDPLRPPPAFVDTGLLGHWGLTLDPPARRGLVRRILGGDVIMTASPGLLSGRCPTSADRLVAHCAIAKGEATIVADADFLDVDDLPGAGAGNLDSLVWELEAAGGS